MKRKLTAMAAALLLICVCGLLMTRLGRLGEPGAEAAAADDRLLSGLNGPVASMTLEYRDGAAYRFEASAAPGQEPVFTGTAQYDGLEWSSERLSGLADICLALRPASEVEANPSPESLALYGLEHPALTLTLTDRDGAAAALKVGDRLKVGGDYYVMAGQAVYVVNKSQGEMLAREIDRYCSVRLFPKEWSHDATADITALTLERGELGETIALRRTDLPAGEEALSPLALVEPVAAHTLRQTLLHNLLNPMIDIASVGKLAAIAPTDLAPYGLDAPACTISIESAAGYFDLLLSAPRDGLVYAMRADHSIVIAISEESAAFLEVDCERFVAPHQWYFAAQKVARVEITTPRIRGELSFDQDFAAAYWNGAPILPADGLELLERCMAIDRAGREEGTGAGEAGTAADYAIAMTCVDGEVTTLEAVQADPRRCTVRIDGAPTGYYCYRQSLENVEEAALLLQESVEARAR